MARFIKKKEDMVVLKERDLTKSLQKVYKMCVCIMRHSRGCAIMFL